MLQTDYPPYFNTTAITCRKLRWQRSYAKIQNIYQTEDGHDDAEIIRSNKSTIACQFRCMDDWVSTFATFNLEPMIDVKFYDVKTKAYVTLVMRMENFVVSERLYSDRLSVTNGIYDVAFNLVEF